MGAIILGPVLPPDWEPPAVPTQRNVGSVLDATHVSLAREIAQGIHELRDILPRYGFRDEADERWRAIAHHPEFTRFLQEAIREWHSADSSEKRIKLKALASIEASIPEVHAMIFSGGAPIRDRVQAFKEMKSLGGMGGDANVKAAGAGGPGFSVTINIGKKESVRLSATPDRPIVDSVASEESDDMIHRALDVAGV